MSSPFVFPVEIIKAFKEYLHSKDVVFGADVHSITKALKNSNVQITKKAYCIMETTVDYAPSSIN